MKGPGVGTVVTGGKFEGVWGELETKRMFPGTIIHRMSETSTNFHVA